MYGSKSMGKLTVSIYGNKGQIIPVNTISGPIEKQWKYAHAKINSVQDYKIVFEGFVGGDEYTDIAIDDVSFTEECQEGGK
ncbi:MAM and LDL-receptor class A domain-containing protein 1-like [Centruroides sculpturatus]|uniref:MAM and LDL-receptor class A domain-containing protein 1-like n=1 Tax=Centruroides sculpturatus TaxID=218467 RepID=UPI000C6E49FC|nr:MAM and LDL-receptor class A domain-containing protein 1-like [Centruroides sculpturatus]